MGALFAATVRAPLTGIVLVPYDELPFDCFLKPGELSGYYADWDILKYNENPGHLHRTDAAGNRIRLNFATLIARKKA